MNDTSETLAAEPATLRAREAPAWADEAPTALLVLADGTVIEGKGAGATGTAVGEVCFNTAMTGYQEILTDPSYVGQMVCMTYPEQGNYGVNAADQESSRPHATGFVVRHWAGEPSSWRAERSIDAYLKAHGIV
ncbi:MAG TPA: carbamoyl-phosphate synthase domain-containing protein, partial [Methyloceanibacter sp.]|nr:carbamoyl-phosphate synthase domain-containing protein [Methyloceanibacter sp.]